MKIWLLVVAALIGGCASTSSQDIAGFGGVNAEKDTFTGTSRIVTGKGHIYCPASESLFCTPGFSMSFAFDPRSPDVVTASAVMVIFENMRDLSLNIDGQIVTIPAGDPRTQFSTAYGVRESIQRYVIPINLARQMTTAASVLIRVELLNNRVTETGDFSRPTSMGQPSAKALLTELLSQIGS